MKKTLFALTALALMGGQVFAEDYYTSTMDPTFEEEEWFEIGKGDILHIDTSEGKKFTGIMEMEGATLSYEGVGNLLCGETLEVMVSKCNITTASDVVTQTWMEAFSAENGGYITLYTPTKGGGANIDYGKDPLLFGVEAGQTLTLVGTEVETEMVLKYIGAKPAEVDEFNSEEFRNKVKDMEAGTVAIYYGYAGMAIAGKGVKTPAVPEPATATLSLLALAGLATRRKRK